MRRIGSLLALTALIDPEIGGRLRRRTPILAVKLVEAYARRRSGQSLERTFAGPAHLAMRQLDPVKHAFAAVG